MKINSHVIYQNNEKELLYAMDKAGFDKSVIEGSPQNAVYTGRVAGSSNESVINALKNNPDRLIGAAYLNPMDDDSLNQAEKWADEGFKCIKLYPADGYCPDDRKLYPFYAKAQELDLSLCVHMGVTDFSYVASPGVRKSPNASFAYPMKLDPICRLFPELNIMILNMGYPIMHEAWSVHHNSSNIYLHLGGGGTSFRAPSTGYVSMGGAGFIPLDEKRLIFGSGLNYDMAQSFALFKESAVRMGFRESAADDAAGENVKRFLKLGGGDDC